MANASQTAVVEVYKDASKREMLVEIPISDIGTVTDGGLKPSGDEELIHIAKYQIQNTRTEDANSLYYAVRR